MNKFLFHLAPEHKTSLAKCWAPKANGISNMSSVRGVTTAVGNCPMKNMGLDLQRDVASQMLISAQMSPNAEILLDKVLPPFCWSEIHPCTESL